MKNQIKLLFYLLFLPLMYSCVKQSANEKIKIPDVYSKKIEKRIYEPLTIENKVEKGKIIGRQFINYEIHSNLNDLYFDNQNRIIMGIEYTVGDSNKLEELFRFKKEYFNNTNLINRITFSNQEVSSTIELKRKSNGKLVEIICDKNSKQFPIIYEDGYSAIASIDCYQNTKYIYNNIDSLTEKHTKNLSTYYSHSTSEDGNAIVSYFILDNTKKTYYIDDKKTYYTGIIEKGYYKNHQNSNNKHIQCIETFINSESDTTKAELAEKTTYTYEYNNMGKLSLINTNINSIINDRNYCVLCKYNYDKYGNLESYSVESKREYQTTPDVFNYTYKYNSKGDWIERILRRSIFGNSVEYIESRTISYK